MHNIKSCLHLDAGFKRVPRQREALLLVDGFAEDNQLLKQEDPPLPASGQDVVLLLAHREGVLLEQLPLGGDFPLRQWRECVFSYGFTMPVICDFFFFVVRGTKRKERKVMIHVWADSGVLAHLKPLEPAHVHHVIATLRHETHHLHRSLPRRKQDGKIWQSISTHVCTHKCQR